MLENSSRGVWAIVHEKRHIEKIDSKSVIRAVREMEKKERLDVKRADTEGAPGDDILEEARSWREELHHILTHEI